MISKHGTLKSPEFLKWIRSLPCFSCRENGVHAHHWPPKGRGVVNDLMTLPLCPKCHKRAHGETISEYGVKLGPLADGFQERGAAEAFRWFFLAAPTELVDRVLEQIKQWRAGRAAWVPF